MFKKNYNTNIVKNQINVTKNFWIKLQFVNFNNEIKIFFGTIAEFNFVFAIKIKNKIFIKHEKKISVIFNVIFFN